MNTQARTSPHLYRCKRGLDFRKVGTRHHQPTNHCHPLFLVALAERLGRTNWNLSAIKGEKVQVYRDTSGVDRSSYRKRVESWRSRLDESRLAGLCQTPAAVGQCPQKK